MTAGAGRAAGAPAGHVDLLDAVEAGGGVTDEHAGQAGREGGSDHDGQGPLPGFGVEGQQSADLGGVVADRHHADAVFEGGLGGGPVTHRAWPGRARRPPAAPREGRLSRAHDPERTRSGTARASTRVASRRASWCTMVSWSSPSVPASCRAARLPTAPMPIRTARTSAGRARRAPAIRPAGVACRRCPASGRWRRSRRSHRVPAAPGAALSSAATGPPRLRRRLQWVRSSVASRADDTRRSKSPSIGVAAAAAGGGVPRRRAGDRAGQGGVCWDGGIRAKEGS